MRAFAEGSANEERSDKPACMVIVSTAERSVAVGHAISLSLRHLDIALY